VCVPSPDATAVPAEPAMELGLEVLLERLDLVVVGKPAGQPTAPIQPGETGTLVNALVARYPEMAGVGYHPREPGILHRLDTGTSGLVLAARTAESFALLSSRLRAGIIRKEYLLVCESAGLSDSGTIDIPIGGETKRSRRVTACVRAEQVRRCDPRPAQTKYHVVQRHGRWALVKVEAPRAVRHQIRAHFAAIGHPLAGDGLYGGNTEVIQRHALHARLIGMSSADGVDGFEVTRELPDDMVGLMEVG